MSKQEQITETVTMRLTGEQMERLRSMQMVEAQALGRSVTMSDTIRNMLFGSEDGANNDLTRWMTTAGWEETVSMAREPIQTRVKWGCVGLKVVGYTIGDQDGARRKAMLGDIPRFSSLHLCRHGKGKTFQEGVSSMIVKTVDNLEFVVNSVVFGAVNRQSAIESPLSYRDDDQFWTALDRAMAKIETEGLRAVKVICNSSTFHGLIKHGQKFDEASQRDLIMTGLYGHIGNCDVHVYNELNTNDVLVLPPGDCLASATLEWHIEPFKDADGYGWTLYARTELDALKRSTVKISKDL